MTESVLENAVNEVSKSRARSPAPSIQRYLDSPELEAGIEAIEQAILSGVTKPLLDTLWDLTGDTLDKRNADATKNFDKRSAYSCPSIGNSAYSGISARSTQSVRASAKLSRRQKAACTKNDRRRDRFRCLMPLCSEDFASKDELADHQRNEHYQRTQLLNYCTFCSAYFSDPNCWWDHEKTAHPNFSSVWTCQLQGSCIITDHGPKCFFCGYPSPNSQHLEKHTPLPCAGLNHSERRFHSEADLGRHLTDMHPFTILTPSSTRLVLWKQRHVQDSGLWRCGICLRAGLGLKSRQTHIRNHWADGCTMKDWRGVAPAMIPLSNADYDALSKLPDSEFRAYVAEKLPRDCTQYLQNSQKRSQ
jgi:hypothetical protein